MEADRGAVLTVRAAARGLIDFGEARVLDLSWWRRTNAVIRAMHRDDRMTTTRFAFDYQLALVGNPQLTDEDWKRSMTAAKEIFHTALGLLEPWAAKTLKEAESENYAAMIDDYRRTVGDPNDPEFRRKLDQDLAAGRARRAAARVRPEGPDDRVARLLAERDRMKRPK